MLKILFVKYRIIPNYNQTYRIFIVYPKFCLPQLCLHGNWAKIKTTEHNAYKKMFYI